jgi:hypothetical protein
MRKRKIVGIASDEHVHPRLFYFSRRKQWRNIYLWSLSGIIYFRGGAGVPVRLRCLGVNRKKLPRYAKT